MRYSFTFAGVFGAIACVEEASLNGDEGIVVIAAKTYLCQLLLMKSRGVADKTGMVDWMVRMLLTSSTILQCGCILPESPLDRQSRHDQVVCAPGAQAVCELDQRLDSACPACIDRVAMSC